MCIRNFCRVYMSCKYVNVWEFPKNSGALIETPNSRALIIRTPQKGTPTYRNRHVFLIRISKKSALYQPQAPFKEPQTLLSSFVWLGRQVRADPRLHLLQTGLRCQQPRAQFGAVKEHHDPWADPKSRSTFGLLELGPKEVYRIHIE